MASYVLVRQLTRELIAQYAEASGDLGPVHLDDGFAQQVGPFPSVIAHGMLTMGMTGQAVSDFIGSAERVTAFGGRFTGVVLPGDTLTSRLEVTAVAHDEVTVSVLTSNQDGNAVFEGYAVARAPSARVPRQRGPD
jgi:acyl dehydratase